MSDTPIFDDMVAQIEFLAPPGAVYGEGNEPPPRKMTLVNYLGQELVWNGKRWYDPEDGDGSLQTQDCWPPYDYGPVAWREKEGP